jgi:hypothetical protein
LRRFGHSIHESAEFWDVVPRRLLEGEHRMACIGDEVLPAQFTALRYFTLDGTDHAGHKEQASMIRRYIIWRNNHAYDERLRRIVGRASTA